MPGLGPGIHAFRSGRMRRLRRRSAPHGAHDVDGPDKPGHDAQRAGLSIWCLRDGGEPTRVMPGLGPGIHAFAGVR